MFFRRCALEVNLGKPWRMINAYSPQAVLNSHFCNHSEEERGFVTTTTEIELNLALDRGYVVKHVYT